MPIYTIIFLFIANVGFSANNDATNACPGRTANTVGMYESAIAGSNNISPEDLAKKISRKIPGLATICGAFDFEISYVYAMQEGLDFWVSTSGFPLAETPKLEDIKKQGIKLINEYMSTTEGYKSDTWRSHAVAYLIQIDALLDKAGVEPPKYSLSINDPYSSFDTFVNSGKAERIDTPEFVTDVVRKHFPYLLDKNLPKDSKGYLTISERLIQLLDRVFTSYYDYEKRRITTIDTINTIGLSLNSERNSKWSLHALYYIALLDRYFGERKTSPESQYPNGAKTRIDAIVLSLGQEPLQAFAFDIELVRINSLFKKYILGRETPALSRTVDFGISLIGRISSVSEEADYENWRADAIAYLSQVEKGIKQVKEANKIPTKPEAAKPVKGAIYAKIYRDDIGGDATRALWEGEKAVASTDLAGIDINFAINLMTAVGSKNVPIEFLKKTIEQRYNLKVQSESGNIYKKSNKVKRSGDRRFYIEFSRNNKTFRFSFKLKEDGTTYEYVITPVVL